MTPHSAGCSEEALAYLIREGARQAIAVLRGVWPTHCVNPAAVPRFALAAAKATEPHLHRLQPPAVVHRPEDAGGPGCFGPTGDQEHIHTSRRSRFWECRIRYGRFESQLLNAVSNSYQLQDDISTVSVRSADRTTSERASALSTSVSNTTLIQLGDDKGVFNFTGAYTQACPLGLAGCETARGAAGLAQGGLPFADYRRATALRTGTF
jgi:hypothetical protein